MKRKKYRVEDYIGKKFGRLTLVSTEPEKDGCGKTVYKCQCECGNICYRRLDILVSGRTKYCDAFCPLRDNKNHPSKHIVGRDAEGNIVAYYYSISLFARVLDTYFYNARKLAETGIPHNGIVYSYQGDDEQIDVPFTIVPRIPQTSKKGLPTQMVHYETSLGKIYLTPCECRKDKDIKVGSTLCRQCSEFIMNNKKEQYVLCYSKKQ